MSSAVTFKQFVVVWRERQEFSGAHPELAGYHETRYRAHAAAFNVDMDLPPTERPAEPAWLASGFDDLAERVGEVVDMSRRHWHTELHRLVLAAERQHRFDGNPFSAYLLPPISVALARRCFAPALQQAIAGVRAEIHELIVELLGAIFVEAASREVPNEALRRHGFDPDAPPPDPDRYW